MDADIMRDIVRLLRERIDQGLLTIFIKIKAHRGDPLNEQADRWAHEGRQSENIRWSLPSNRPIFHWTDQGTTHRSPMNPTVKKTEVYGYGPDGGCYNASPTNSPVRYNSNNGVY